MRPSATAGDLVEYLPLCLVDGRIVSFDEATVHVDSQANRYALSVFEGVRGYWNVQGRVVPFRLKDHVDRLVRSISLARLPSWRDYDLHEKIQELLESCAPNGDCYLRISASADGLGDLNAGERLKVVATVQRMGRKPWLKTGRKSSLCVSRWSKGGEDVLPAACKTVANYFGPRLALLEAKDLGFDTLVLRTRDGAVSEAPTSNLFVVKEGRIRTPRLVDAILPGITRAWVIGQATRLGHSVVEERIEPTDLDSADEIFLTGTGLEFGAISRIGEIVLPSATPVADSLVAAYFSEVRGGKVSSPFSESPC